MRPTTCRSCDAKIFWARTVNGKAMPLDAEPVPTGNVIVVDGEAFVQSKPDDLLLAEFPKYLPHHMTCPHGKDWKR